MPNLLSVHRRGFRPNLGWDYICRTRCRTPSAGLNRRPVDRGGSVGDKVRPGTHTLGLGGKWGAQVVGWSQSRGPHILRAM